MHETSIIQSLSEQVISHIPENTFVIEVKISVGKLEHLDDEVMQTAWQAISDNKVLSRAKLIIERIPLLIRCGVCQNEYKPDEPELLLCPVCESVRPIVLAGSGVILQKIEVETIATNE